MRTSEFRAGPRAVWDGVGGRLAMMWGAASPDTSVYKSLGDGQMCCERAKDSMRVL